jgi:prepilin-type N-terminal cleavage/methylation domain-containing protein
MQISILKTSNKSLQGQHGFSLIEIMVALLLAALVFLAIPSGDSAQKHRALQTALSDIDRSIRFAANEAILRNTVVRLRISLDETPVEYTVEYGPAGNLPLPEMPENMASLSLAEQKAMQDKTTALSRQFAKVEEFEDIKQSIHEEVTILGVATSAQSGIITEGEANIYFYPTGEKDAALIFLSTVEEVAHLEVAPFLFDTRSVFFTLDASSVAKLEDLLQTRMNEVYREWVY